jgi:hypothetical protein
MPLSSGSSATEANEDPPNGAAAGKLENLPEPNCSSDLLTARRFQSQSTASGVTLGQGCRAQRGQLHQPADLKRNAPDANTAAGRESSHHWHAGQTVTGCMQLQQEQQMQPFL